MTRTRARPDPVSPSAPDPVDAWLEVLVAMLAIPKADRRTVRDELEDHLRSRIDDLLIHGLTEPQALQKAVAELGETADLARQLSHAHRTPRTRRYAMHALLIALTGTVVALGVSNVRPAAPAAAMVEAASAAVAPASDNGLARAEPEADLLATTAEVPVGRSASIREVMSPFADKLGLTLEVDQMALAQRGITPIDGVMLADVPGPRTMGAVLNAISHAIPIDEWHKYGEADRVVADRFGDRLIVTTVRGLDQRTMTRRVYPLAGFSHAPASADGSGGIALQHVRQAVIQHVSPTDWQDNGGELATATLLGSSLIVTAPARFHDEIEGFLSEVNQQMDRSAEALVAEHDRVVANLKSEYEHALQDYERTGEGLDRIKIRTVELAADIKAAADLETRTHLEKRSIELETQSRALQMRLEESAARVRYLRSRMIATEYEPLLQGLPASHQPAVALPPEAMRIEGAVDRPGDYEVPPMGITLKRLIAVAGGLNAPDARVHVMRDGSLFMTTSIREIHGGAGETELKPGDRVAVSKTANAPAD